MASPGRTCRAAEREPARNGADARRIDEELVGRAAPDDLRVAGDDGDAGARRRRPRRFDDPPQIVDRQPLLEDEGERERQRARAADGEIVDGAVHRQLADVAAAKEDRRHDKGVGGERQPRAVALDDGGVVERLRAPDCANAGTISSSTSCAVKRPPAAVAHQDFVGVDERQRTGGERQHDSGVRGHRLLPGRRGADPTARAGGSCASPECGGSTSSAPRRRARRDRRARHRRARRSRR